MNHVPTHHRRQVCIPVPSLREQLILLDTQTASFFLPAQIPGLLILATAPLGHPQKATCLYLGTLRYLSRQSTENLQTTGFPKAETITKMQDELGKVLDCR